MADLKAEKGGSLMSKTWGFFFGGSVHGPESSYQISAYYKFFLGLHVLYRISTGLMVYMFAIQLLRKNRIALRAVHCID